MLFLIVTKMISALCVVFDCHDDDDKCALCCFVIITVMISVLFVRSDCYHDD